MKKSILLTFVIAAAFAATFLSGCSKSSGVVCNSLNGVRDTGVHVIYLNGATNALLPQIRDTLDAVVINGDSVRITSKSLGQIITGKLDASDCNKIILDSVYIPHLAFPDTQNLIAADSIIISNVRAGGTGTITTNGASTIITVAKGNTNIDILGGILLDIGGGTFSLRGTFLKLP